jgi:phosphatidylserine decarboxylase
VDESAHDSVADQNFAVVQNKHRGRSLIDGLRIIAGLTLAFGLGALLAFMSLPAAVWMIVWIIGPVWIICAMFVLFFFRDANPVPPREPGVILSPAHGTIDYIDSATETHFLNGSARRISIYLSLLNVHVQHAPVSGRVEALQHFPGRWSRAIRRDASLRNEHLLVGLTCSEERQIAIRQISGIWVRRIVPWITRGQHVVCGERIGLIRFGSRVDIFLPLDVQVNVKPGDKVHGGETILARFNDDRS